MKKKLIGITAGIVALAVVGVVIIYNHNKNINTPKETPFYQKHGTILSGALKVSCDNNTTSNKNENINIDSKSEQGQKNLLQRYAKVYMSCEDIYKSYFMQVETAKHLRCYYNNNYSSTMQKDLLDEKKTGNNFKEDFDNSIKQRQKCLKEISQEVIDNSELAEFVGEIIKYDNKHYMDFFIAINHCFDSDEYKKDNISKKMENTINEYGKILDKMKEKVDIKAKNI